MTWWEHVLTFVASGLAGAACHQMGYRQGLKYGAERERRQHRCLPVLQSDVDLFEAKLREMGLRRLNESGGFGRFPLDSGKR